MGILGAVVFLDKTRLFLIFFNNQYKVCSQVHDIFDVEEVMVVLYQVTFTY
jgi:hypothetical protein